jgi:hypothetical protein
MEGVRKLQWKLRLARYREKHGGGEALMSPRSSALAAVILVLVMNQPPSAPAQPAPVPANPIELAPRMAAPTLSLATAMLEITAAQLKLATAGRLELRVSVRNSGRAPAPPFEVLVRRGGPPIARLRWPGLAAGAEGRQLVQFALLRGEARPCYELSFGRRVAVPTLTGPAKSACLSGKPAGLTRLGPAAPAVGGLPDLVVISVGLDGDALRFRVRNLGPGTKPAGSSVYYEAYLTYRYAPNAYDLVNLEAAAITASEMPAGSEAVDSVTAPRFGFRDLAAVRLIINPISPGRTLPERNYDNNEYRLAFAFPPPPPFSSTSGPDLVVTDVALGGPDGDDVLFRVKNRGDRPKPAGVPVGWKLLVEHGLRLAGFPGATQRFDGRAEWTSLSEIPPGGEIWDDLRVRFSDDVLRRPGAVRIIINPQRTVGETNYDNNEGTLAWPTLGIRAARLHVLAPPSHVSWVEFVIQNISDASWSGGFVVRVTLASPTSPGQIYTEDLFVRAWEGVGPRGEQVYLFALHYRPELQGQPGCCRGQVQLEPPTGPTVPLP